MKDITSLKFITNEVAKTYQAERGFRGTEVAYGQSGGNLLAQLVATWLYKTPGQDAITPDLGGGLAELAFSNPSDEQNIEYKIVLAIDAVESQIKTYQAGQSYPKDEMLKNLAIHPTKGIIFHEDTRIWEINLTMTSLSGEEFKINIPISTGG